MRKYETVIVIDSLLKAEEIDNIINKYKRFISANGGQITTIDRWGKRRLAYEIKKRQYGFYVLIRFDGPPAMIKQLYREFRLNEALLRTMITQLDKKALAAIENNQLPGQQVRSVKNGKDHHMEKESSLKDKVVDKEELPVEENDEKSANENPVLEAEESDSTPEEEVQKEDELT